MVVEINESTQTFAEIGFVFIVYLFPVMGWAKSIICVLGTYLHERGQKNNVQTLYFWIINDIYFEFS